MDKRITFLVLGIVLIISGCLQSTKDKEPVTPNTTAVATSVMPTKVQNTSTNTVLPIIVVSVQDMKPYVPAGPIVNITLKASSTDEPVTSLSATLSIIAKNQTFNFPDITQSNPLMPDQTTSQTLIIVGPAGYNSDSTYPLLIEGTLQSGQTFNYTMPVMITPGGYINESYFKKNVIKRGTFNGKSTNISDLLHELNLTHNESLSYACVANNCTYEVIKVD